MRIKIKALRKKDKNRNRVQQSWPFAYRWAAMGTLVAYSAVGSKTFNVARAQDVQGNGQANGPISQTQGAQPVRRHHRIGVTASASVVLPPAKIVSDGGFELTVKSGLDTTMVKM